MVAVIVAVYKCAKIGMSGLILEIQDTENRVSSYTLFMFLAFIFCLLPICVYLLVLNGKTIYSFELLIYIHIIPLIVLILLANLIPKQNRNFRLTRYILFCSTIFLIPLTSLAYEFALPMFGISTSI